MRNILFFPDGSQQHFMYPENREIQVGEQLQVQLNDDSVHVFKVKNIEQKDLEVHYILDYS